METRGNTLTVIAVLVTIAFLGLALAWIAVPDKTTVRVTVPGGSLGCACSAPAAAPVKKYLIFWKEKDGYKASPVLFPSLESASAAIPRDAEEARIVPVRID